MTFNLNDLTSGTGTDVSTCTVSNLDNVSATLSAWMSLLGVTVSTQAVANSGNYTIPTNSTVYILTGSGTFTPISITLPPTPSVPSPLTIVSEVTVTALTITPNSNQSSLITFPTTISAGGVIRLLFYSGVWYPR